jgi:hypothetical protein
MFKPKHWSELSKTQHQTVLESHMFLKEKWDGSLKGRTVADVEETDSETTFPRKMQEVCQPLPQKPYYYHASLMPRKEGMLL